LDKKLLHIKIEVCEKNSTRDAVIGEERLKSNAKGNRSVTKVIDRYMVAVKKEGIIIGDFP